MDVSIFIPGKQRKVHSWNLSISNLWMIRSNQVMISKFISCNVSYSDDAFLILTHRNYRNACWKSLDWSRARAAIYRFICSRDGWRCRESTTPSAFRVQRPNTSHKHPICCCWLLRTSRTKRAFTSLCWRTSCTISIKREIKTSNVEYSQTQRDDLGSTVLHGTVLILVINEAELQHNLFPRSS